MSPKNADALAEEEPDNDFNGGVDPHENGFRAFHGPIRKPG